MARCVELTEKVEVNETERRKNKREQQIICRHPTGNSDFTCYLPESNFE